MASPAEDDLPSDCIERIERVCGEAADAFRTCPGNLLAQLQVCARYFQRGEQEGISRGELIDFLGISSPSVLDRAGYGDDEALRVMAGLTLLTEDEQGVLQPPTALPATPNPPSAIQSTFNL